MISLFGNLLLYSAVIVAIATVIYSKLFNIELNKRYRYSSFFTVAQFLFIFFKVAILGTGILLFVNNLITSEASGPEILTIATPDIPGPVDKA